VKQTTNYKSYKKCWHKTRWPV